ncbi:hypothetical protein [Cupriavidus sp.]|uniref:hypothetical protein n=1 Tax=Cupriavidus sp. TaxID=1873897 RepID=UPI0028BE0179|nr:hypothetical protein [Cupriavidus sp.]
MPVYRGSKEDATHAAIEIAKSAIASGSLNLWDGHVAPKEEFGKNTADFLANFIETLAERLSKM